MNQEPNTFESTRNTSQDEILKSDPIAEAVEFQNLDKKINVTPPTLEDDVKFWDQLSSTARKQVRVEVNSSDAQDITVEHPTSSEAKKPHSKRNRILAGVGLTTVAIAGTTALTLGPIADVVDEHFEHQSEQNKKWSDEAEEAQRQLDNGTVIIDLPPENK